MKRIFISYKRADKDKVFPLVEEIEKKVGEECWVDLKGIESNAQFGSVICRAIDNAEVVLFMHSSAHLYIDFEKDWTVKELTYAQAKNKRVQLVKLDDSPLDNIFLMEYGSKNNTDSNDPVQFNKLINDLRVWLGKPAMIPGSHVSSNLVNLKVLANVDCKVLIDYEDKGVAMADRLMKILLAPGDYYAEFVSTKNADDVVSREITLTQDKIEKVDMLSVQQSREEEAMETAALLPYISNNKVGFANRYTRAIIIPCKYDRTGSFTGGLATVQLNGKWGCIDKAGNEVVPCKYDSTSSFSEGLSRVILNGKHGYVDKSGREVIPCKYDFALHFSDGLARVKMNRKYGYIDKSGREVIPYKYDSADSFNDGVARVKLNGKYGYIDKSGTEIIPCEYEYADPFREGLAIVKSYIYDVFRCIDKTGRKVFSCSYRYHQVDSFCEGVAAFLSKFGEGPAGYIDKSGQEVFVRQYLSTSSFSEGLARVQQHNQYGWGKYGFIDKTGREVIPCKYDKVSSFNEGLAYVELNGKWGYIDKTGREVIPCKYDEVGCFYEGLAYVKLNGKYGFIDKTGREITPCKYDDAKCFNEGLAHIKFDGKSGYIDIFGNEMLTEN